MTADSCRRKVHGPWHLLVALYLLLLGIGGTQAQDGYGFAAPGSFTLKIFRVDNALYPFVQVYMRTFDDQQQPLVNLNELNIGLMVKGKSYDVAKRQYGVQSLRQRQEATRSVIVLDASKSMAGKPFRASVEAAIRFIEGKRPQDEVAVLAVRDEKSGYDLVSPFERDGKALARRIADIKPDGLRTRLYDSIGAALQMCAMSAQGSVVRDAYVVSCSVLVFSDGHDEGSAVSREELMTRISGLSIPIPIYSLAYSKESPTYFKNMAALSKNSLGIYYHIGETMDRMTRIVEEIQNILQSDYVVTFRSYVPPDGNQYNFKLGLEYPSGSGKFVFDADTFEAIEPLPIPALQAQVAKLHQIMPAPRDGNPGSPPPGTPEVATTPAVATPPVERGSTESPPPAVGTPPVERGSKQ